MSRFSRQSIKGFTLLEILVSTIIMAIGLLGLAAMQTMALKDNQDAFFYAQSSSLAYEMSDRIRVNPVPWRSATLPTADACNKRCDFNDKCTPDQMATYDYCSWISNVQSRIANSAIASVTVSGTVGTCNGGATKRCLTISWPRSQQKSNGATTSTFQMEIAP